MRPRRPPIRRSRCAGHRRRIRSGCPRNEQPAGCFGARTLLGQLVTGAPRSVAGATGAGGHQDRHRHRGLHSRQADRRAAPAAELHRGHHHRPIRPRWANQLRLDLAGTPERNEANVITALSYDEAFAGALVFDEFRQEIMVARACLGTTQPVRCRGPGCDADDVRCAEWLQRREINVAPVVVSRSVPPWRGTSGSTRSATILNGLRWDGVQRLDTWA